MDRALQGYSQVEGHIKCAPLASGTGWGLVGGLTGTIVMDILLMGVLLAVRHPVFLCFSIVGDTVSRFFSKTGLQLAGGVPTGVAAHYVIGPLVGALFGAAAALFPALQVGTPKKGAIAAILYVEI